MRKRRTKGKTVASRILSITYILLASIAISFFMFIYFSNVKALENNVIAASINILDIKINKYDVRHLKTPEKVYAVYMSTCAAATESFRKHIKNIIETTSVNSVVLDIKDFAGNVSFISTNADINTPDVQGCVVKDMKEYIRELNEMGVYVIGRLTAFQDPNYANKNPHMAVQNKDGSVWKDNKGLSFVDVGATEFWEYLVTIAIASYEEFGFDEINFDYIRYPSDGDLSDVYYPITDESIVADPDLGKTKELEKFFKHIDIVLRKSNEIPISADIFGQAAINKDDLNIGHILEYVLPYFDYVALMLYPSHFLNGAFGLKTPNDDPYLVVKKSLESAVERSKVAGYKSTALRPWIQDFDYPVPYTEEDVKGQIRATVETETSGWMLWDPAVRYTPSAF